MIRWCSRVSHGAPEGKHYVPDLTVQRALRDSDRLQALRESGLLEVTPEETFDRITRLSKRLLDVPVALINLLDDERQIYSSCFGLPAELEIRGEIGLSHSYCKHVVATGEPIVAPDAREHPLLRGNPAIEDLDAIAYLGVPLVTRDGHVLGSHCAIDHEPREWAEEDVEILEVHAQAAATEIDLRREKGRLTALQEELEQRVEERTAALRESRNYLQRLFTESPVGIALVSGEGRPVAVNDTLTEMLGYERDELRDMTFPEFTHPEDVDRDVEHVEKLLAGEIDQYSLEKRYITGSGDVIWVDLLVTTVPDREDESARIMAYARDVTDRVRAREALERAKEKFEGVFETSPVAMKIIRPETGEYLAVNEAFEKVFGFKRSAVLDGSVTRSDLWEDPDDRTRIYGRLEHERSIHSEEVRLRRRDGTTFEALLSASWLEMGDDRFLVTAVQDIAHLKEVERQLEHRTLHDRLTGLPNRALFWDRVEHALERKRTTDETVGVLLLDLDDFGHINEEYGHGVGDEVLRKTAERLRSAVRDADTAARLASDEFGVLLEDLTDPDEAEERAERVSGRLSESLSVDGGETPIRVSCGIAVAADGDDVSASTAGDLIRHAERAMYLAKETPGSAYRCYEAGLEERPTDRLRREVELEKALEDGNVLPYYQPIVELETGRIVGAEALARWVRPEQGTVPPGDFIPLAEGTGLIVELGRRMAEAACEQLSAWEDEGLLPAAFQLHLNISARELDVDEFVPSFADLLTDSGIAPHRLAVEVTETVALESTDELDAIRELGCPVAVDDFGTRYATLERLAQLDMDTLKVDRSFVTGIGESGRHEAVLDASLTLAESLGLCPVAEGVESEVQRDWLIAHGFLYGQGFLYHRAVPAGAFTDLLRAGERSAEPTGT